MGTDLLRPLRFCAECLQWVLPRVALELQGHRVGASASAQIFQVLRAQGSSLDSCLPVGDSVFLLRTGIPSSALRWPGVELAAEGLCGEHWNRLRQSHCMTEGQLELLAMGGALPAGSGPSTQRWQAEGAEQRTAGNQADVTASGTGQWRSAHVSSGHAVSTERLHAPFLHRSRTPRPTAPLRAESEEAALLCPRFPLPGDSWTHPLRRQDTATAN